MTHDQETESRVNAYNQIEAELKAVTKERDSLRAKVASLECQTDCCDGTGACSDGKCLMCQLTDARLTEHHANEENTALRAKVQELEGLGQSFREFCLMNPDKVHDVPDDVWIPFSQGFKSAFTIDNARKWKPTSVPEHSPENRTTDP